MKPTFNNVSMYKSFKVAGCGVHLKKHTHKKTFASSILARIRLVEPKKERCNVMYQSISLFQAGTKEASINDVRFFGGIGV